MLANFQHFKFTTHRAMKNLTERRMETLKNYAAGAHAPRHNKKQTVQKQA